MGIQMLMPLGTEPTLTLQQSSIRSIVKILSELAAETTSLLSFVAGLGNGLQIPLVLLVRSWFKSIKFLSSFKLALMDVI